VRPRRRIDLFRLFLITLATLAALGLFLVYYRTWPQRMDCLKLATRVAHACQTRWEQTGALPFTLETLDVKPGRFPLRHYDYRFVGFGSSDKLPDGTIIAYCQTPHQNLFQRPGRSVLFVEHGRLVVRWLTEDQFQKMLKSH